MMKRKRPVISHSEVRALGNLLLLSFLCCQGVASSQGGNDHPFWKETGRLSIERTLHTATLLQNGKVLVAGGLGKGRERLNSAELYDPKSETWRLTGSLGAARAYHTATLLPNGKVLVAGGFGADATAELYDPASESWSATSNLKSPRAWHSALALANGNVLVAGGFATFGPLASAELYDADSATWTLAGSSDLARAALSMTLLPDGKVLVAGGSIYQTSNFSSNYAPIYEVTDVTQVYDPSTHKWRVTGPLNWPSAHHTATLLPNGKVLVVGGDGGEGNDYGSIGGAQLYDPAAGTWSSLDNNLTLPRVRHTATLLRNGKVLVVGGPPSKSKEYGSVGAAELYDPTSGLWSPSDSLERRTSSAYNDADYLSEHTATLLSDGRVLIAGGRGEYSLSDTALYSPSFESTTFFVPIVLSSTGLGGSDYSSELTLANRSAQEVAVEFTYIAAFGEGSGVASDLLRAGQQRIVPDAIAYLRQLGVPIPEAGNQGGTLRVRFSGLSSPEEASVLVRTTTAVPEGRAGLLYAGVPRESLLEGPAYLCGLRQDATDRSNLALQNAGDSGSGDITLRVRVFSGNVDLPVAADLPDIVIAPGGFYQINEVLRSNGLSLTSGYVRVERVSGLAPYYAYAVINNQLSSDGSFVAPVPEDSQTSPYRLRVPLEPGFWPNSSISEWVLTNLSSSEMQLRLYSAAEPFLYGDPQSYTSVWLRPGEQMFLRSDRGFDFVPWGSLVVIDSEVYRGLGHLYVGVRVLGRERDLSYGFSFAGIPSERESQTEAWLFGLQQNSETRTDLVLVSLVDEATTFDIELFDGETGLRAGMVQNLRVSSPSSLQLSSLLATYAPGVTQGYARVVARGAGSFVAHAIILDGAQTGERSGDGSVIYSTP